MTSEQLWQLQTLFRAGVTFAHALREQEGTLTEDVQLRGSKRAVEQYLSMREFG